MTWARLCATLSSQTPGPSATSASSAARAGPRPMVATCSRQWPPRLPARTRARRRCAAAAATGRRSFDAAEHGAQRGVRRRPGASGSWRPSRGEGSRRSSASATPRGKTAARRPRLARPATRWPRHQGRAVVVRSASGCFATHAASTKKTFPRFSERAPAFGRRASSSAAAGRAAASWAECAGGGRGRRHACRRPRPSCGTCTESWPPA
mmetsp:Transcript_94370/g.275952  ORF Transcript_94370/g.275952 Transcript_94370/m.275952 type:complete len:209 (+) Transcript_94370:178-804(+)